jgi:HSP20 family protein
MRNGYIGVSKVSARKKSAPIRPARTPHNVFQLFGNLQSETFDAANKTWEERTSDTRNSEWNPCDFLTARPSFSLKPILFRSFDMFDTISTVVRLKELMQYEVSVNEPRHAGYDIKTQTIVGILGGAAIVARGVKAPSARTRQSAIVRKFEDDMALTPWRSEVPNSVEPSGALPVPHSMPGNNTIDSDTVMSFKNMQYNGNGVGHFAERADHPLATMQREIDRAVEKACLALEPGNRPMLIGVDQWPSIDVIEDEKTLTLRADVTGVDPKDLEVEITGDQLSIHCSRNEERTEDKRGYLCYEGRAGGFSRTLSLPPHLDCDQIDARYQKGVLTIAIAKIPDHGPRRISVKTA